MRFYMVLRTALSGTGPVMRLCKVLLFFLISLCGVLSASSLLGTEIRAEKSTPFKNKKSLHVGLNKEIQRIEAMGQKLAMGCKPRDPTTRETDRDGRFIAYDNRVVVDTKTGLEWFAGVDGDLPWEGAKLWAESLSVDGGGWRMPSIKELETLYQKGKGKQNMTPLLKTTGWGVWSGETKKPSFAWYFYFHTGRKRWGSRSFSLTLRAFAVRSRSDW